MKRKKKKTHRSPRRRHNPANPRVHRRRRRRNPSSTWWKGPLGVALSLVGGALALGLHFGLQQTDLSNTTVGTVQVASGLVGGLGLSLLSPEVGGGLAVLGTSLGALRLMQQPITKSRQLPAATTARAMRLRANLAGLDEDDLDAIGAVTAMLGDGADDDEMGAVTAQLGDGEEDEDELGAVTAQLGDGEEDEDEMGAVTAQLGDFEPEEDEMGAWEEDGEEEFS